MMEYIPFAALGLALVTFAFSTFQFRYNARSTYVQMLEHRARAMEERLARYESRIAELEEENTRLLQRLFHSSLRNSRHIQEDTSQDT